MGNLKTAKRSCQILFGITIGFILATKLQLNYETIRDGVLQRFCHPEFTIPHEISFEKSLQTIQNLYDNFNKHDSDRENPQEKQKLLLIGIMTAKKFLNSRSLAILDTWAQDLDGDIVFFSSSGSR